MTMNIHEMKYRAKHKSGDLLTKQLVRPFTFLRKGPKAYEKLPHYMPYGRPTLPRLCKVDALDTWELVGKVGLALRDANGTHFMLSFDDLPRGPWGPPRYQAWLLAKSRKVRGRACRGMHGG